MILTASCQMKLIITSDLMFFNVRDVRTTFPHEMFLIAIIYRNNNLFPRWIFYYHLNARPRFTIIFDNFLDIFNVSYFESRECFFDFENFLSVVYCQRSLSVRFTRVCLNLRWFCWLEIFGDLIDLFGGFCRDGRRNLLNTSWLISIFPPFLPFFVGVVFGVNWSKTFCLKVFL